MANQEHLEILKRGVEVWNQWRSENLLQEIDLREVDLNGISFRGANLRDADLQGINLNNADLTDADLSKANLTGAELTNATINNADLRGALVANTKFTDADLTGANFYGTDLRTAELNNANLSEANLDLTDLRDANLHNAKLISATLYGAQLIKANILGANFSNANLLKANLNRAKLIGVNFNGANLTNVNLILADLREADLSNAIACDADFSRADLRNTNLINSNLHNSDLTRADLSYANCEAADFSLADLRMARLIKANLNGAVLTNAHLWQTQRAGWSIKGVVCESAYFEEDDNSVINFAPGEFERLYSDKTKIVLFYRDGINTLEISTLPALVKYLEESCSGCNLRLESIADSSGGAVVTLAIDNADDISSESLKQLKTELEETARQVIEFERKALVERETRLQLEGEVKQLNSVVDKLILKPSFAYYNQENTTVGDVKMGDTFNTNQAGAVGPNAHAHDMTFNQIGGQIEQSMDLSKLAAELVRLREAMSQEAKEPDHYVALGEVAKAEQAAKAKDSSKVAESLKAAGKWALDTATKIGTSLATEAIKKSIGM
jgi:uncharacterized protein YjbI with pentapeptide repeats